MDIVRDLIEVGVSPAPSSNDRGCPRVEFPESVDRLYRSTSSFRGFLGLGGGRLGSV